MADGIHLGCIVDMEDVTLRIEMIYIPVKRRKSLKREIVETLAESIMENGQKTPILVRQDGERFVLIEGLHRLEACKALGEETIAGVIVQARRH